MTDSLAARIGLPLLMLATLAAGAAVAARGEPTAAVRTGSADAPLRILLHSAERGSPARRAGGAFVRFLVPVDAAPAGNGTAAPPVAPQPTAVAAP